MKSFLVILTVLATLSLPAAAADTNTVFKWQRPDQSGMLTISNLNLRGAVSLPAGASLANLPVVLTNVSAQTATVAGTVTPQAGPDVTATAVVTPQAGPDVTAPAVNTPQTDTITVTLSPQTVDVTNAAGGISAVWTNATASFTGMTNATIVVTVANGAGLLTNATAAITVANGTGLLTNATVSTAGVTTNVLKTLVTP